jgi:hypothetical protein
MEFAGKRLLNFNNRRRQKLLALNYRCLAASTGKSNVSKESETGKSSPPRTHWRTRIPG